MRKRIAVLLLACVTALGLMLVGCGGSGSSSSSSAASSAGTSTQKSSNDTVTIAMTPDAEPAAGFDPILGWATAEHTHDPLIQSTLLVTNDDLSIGKDLATDYEISEDGLTWTFKIRDDVKFTNGDKLTAEDVAYTYNKVKDQAIEADFSMLDSVEATDDTTAVFHLNKPYNIFAYTVAVMGIVPHGAYDAKTYGDEPIGSGPFMLKEWNKGEQVTLEANPDYYGDEPNIKNINVVFMSEEASYAAAANGSVDVAYTQPNYTQKPVEGYSVYSFISEDIRGIVMPTQPEGSTYEDSAGNKEPAGDDVTCVKSVRQALSCCLDREAMVKNIEYGYGSVAYTDCSGMKWESEDMKVDYDPEKAKKIMEDDGWKLNSDNVYERDGLVCEFDLHYDASNAVRTGLAMAVQENAAAVGIKVNPVGFNSFDEMAGKTHDVAWICGAGRQDPGALVGDYYSGKNSPMYSNKTVDKYMDEALAKSNIEDSYDLWKKAQWDGETGPAPQGDAPWVWLVNCDHLYFLKDGLHIVDNKIQPHGHGWTVVGNIENWYWD